MKRIDDSDYLKCYPWYSNKPRELPDGNSLLYMGIRIVILNKFGLLTKDDCEWFIDAVKDCYAKPGLLHRGANKKYAQKHDDYMGVCAASHIVDPTIADDIARYGFLNGWIYQDMEDDNPLNFHFYRLAGVIQHIRVCAGLKLNLLDQLIWSASVVFTTFSNPGATSGRILKWLMVKSIENKGYLMCDIAAWWFKRDIKRRYPGLMGDVFAIYFSSEYPFSVYMRGEI
jgi:hypothetical protein